MAGTVGARNTQAVLRDGLRLSPGEATARVHAARRLGSRETLTGQALPPEYARVAAAQADGAISAEQARVITATVEDLPAGVRAEHGESVEQTLVAAGRFDPTVLARLGRHLHAVLDPDGTLATDEDQQRRRGATLTQNRDGCGDRHAHLTPDTLATVQAALLPLAAPRPCGQSRDERTAPQRLHDAIDTAAGLLLRCGQLPASGGTPATILLTITLDQLESRTAGNSPSPRPSASPAKPTSSPSWWMTEPASSATAGPGASPPPRNAAPSPPATAAASSPDATTHRTGPKPTTSPRGTEAPGPTWTTWPCSATTTTTTNAQAGASSCATAHPGPSPHPGSTPTKHRSATPSTTSHRSADDVSS